MRRSSNLVSAILITGIASVAAAQDQGAGGTQPPGTTSICRFTSGPRAGQTQDLSAMPGVTPIRIGASCSDGALSSGTAIAPSGRNEEPQAAPTATIPTTDTAEKPWSTAAAADAGQAVSTICQFVSGPKAHGWHDYAPLSPAVLGSSCRDGIASAGVVVAAGHGQQY